MNIVLIAQIVGVASIFLLFVLKFWIAIDKRSSNQTLRTAILWTSIYIFFLFILRIFSIFNLATQDQLRVVGGFTSIIPLIAVICQLFLQKKMTDEE